MATWDGLKHWSLNKMADILQTTIHMYFLEVNIFIFNQISLKLVPEGQIDNKLALV